MPRSVIETPWVVLTSCASAVAGSTTTAASQQRSLERMATSSSSRSVTRFGTTRALDILAQATRGRQGPGGRALTTALGGRRFGGPTNKWGLSHDVDPGVRSAAQLDPIHPRCGVTDPRAVRPAGRAAAEAPLVCDRRGGDRGARGRLGFRD